MNPGINVLSLIALLSISTASFAAPDAPVKRRPYPPTSRPPEIQKPAFRTPPPSPDRSEIQRIEPLPEKPEADPVQLAGYIAFTAGMLLFMRKATDGENTAD